MERLGRFLFIIFILSSNRVHQSSCATISRLPARRTVNKDSAFVRWPNNQVSFYFDASYTPEEVQLVRLAMVRVMADMDFCVQFVEVDPKSTLFKLRITPTVFNGEEPAEYCNAMPGLWTGAASAGTEQKLTLARGPKGCLSGSLRKVMKYLAISLGKRNEHQRPDRDGYIRLLTDNILPEMKVPAFRTYSSNEAFSTCSYDYCSITHNAAQDYALPGLRAFEILNPPYFIPELDRLSQCDCIELCALYGCSMTKCQSLNCAAVSPSLQQSQPAALSLATTISPVGTQPALYDGELVTMCYTVDSSGIRAIADGSAELPQQTMGPEGFMPQNCFIEADLGKLREFPHRDYESRAIKARLQGARAMDRDPNYTKWPFNKVPYYIDHHYTKAEQKYIRDAINTISEDLRSCVQFEEVRSSQAEYKLKITPLAEDGKTVERQCYTYPGIYNNYLQTRHEQLLVLARGPDGCLGETRNNILKYLAVALGKRPEHQRPDRDQYLQIIPENIQPGMLFAYSTYNWTFANSDYPYDLCSVTHNQPESFALPGKQAFVVKKPPYRIPMRDHLSETDCKEILQSYGCDVKQCVALRCDLLTTTVGPQTTSGNGPGTSPTPTTDQSTTEKMLPVTSSHADGNLTTYLTDSPSTTQRDQPSSNTVLVTISSARTVEAATSIATAASPIALTQTVGLMRTTSSPALQLSSLQGTSKSDPLMSQPPMQFSMTPSIGTSTGMPTSSSTASSMTLASSTNAVPSSASSNFSPTRTSSTVRVSRILATSTQNLQQTPATTSSAGVPVSMSPISTVGVLSTSTAASLTTQKSAGEETTKAAAGNDGEEEEETGYSVDEPTLQPVIQTFDSAPTMPSTTSDSKQSGIADSSSVSTLDHQMQETAAPPTTTSGISESTVKIPVQVSPSEGGKIVVCYQVPKSLKRLINTGNFQNNLPLLHRSGWANGKLTCVRSIE